MICLHNLLHTRMFIPRGIESPFKIHTPFYCRIEPLAACYCPILMRVRPRVSSRAIHNEGKFFHYRPNINPLAETSNRLPRYLLHQRQACLTCHEKRCWTLRRLQDGMEAELPIKPSIWARMRTHAKRIHTVYTTTTTNKTPSTRISYKPCSKSVYIPFPVVHLPRGIHSKSPLLHHIVRMHILTHPPVSSCTSDLFPFPYPQANTTTRCLQEVLSATSPPSWDSTLMVGNSTEDLKFWLEVLAQVHDGSDVSAAVAVVGC
jgi:hypothetical protein